MTDILVLSGIELQRILTMPDAISAMRRAFVALHSKQAIIPQRIHLDVPAPKGVALFMPAYLDQSIGIKTVTLFDDNPKHGIPYIQGMYCLFDGANGTPTAIMDGKTLTAIRTGAASGLATDLLAREDAEVVAILGAGVQARTQLEAVCAVREIKRASVYDPFPDNARRFADEMGAQLGLSISVAADSAQAICDADIVCAATVSMTPVFDDADLAPGTHVNAIGSYKPDVQEIPQETVLRAKVVTDDKAAALAETGDLIIPIEKGLMTAEHLHAELGAIVAGASTGRTSAEEITFFKSVGLAVQDLAAAKQAVALAEQQGIGIRITL